MKSLCPFNSSSKHLKSFRKCLKLTRLTMSLPPEESISWRSAWEMLILSNQQRHQKEAQIHRGTWKGHSPVCWAVSRLCSVLGIPSFLSCCSSRGGLWWCNCLWVISSHISNLSPIWLQVTTVKSIGLPHWTLVVSLLWSVVSSLTGIGRYLLTSLQEWWHSVVCYFA